MAEFPENVRNLLNDKGVGSPGRIRTSNISVNSLVPDLESSTILVFVRSTDGKVYLDGKLTDVTVLP
jgi:hypothetical protein